MFATETCTFLLTSHKGKSTPLQRCSTQNHPLLPADTLPTHLNHSKTPQKSTKYSVEPVKTVPETPANNHANRQKPLGDTRTFWVNVFARLLHDLTNLQVRCCQPAGSATRRQNPAQQRTQAQCGGMDVQRAVMAALRREPTEDEAAEQLPIPDVAAALDHLLQAREAAACRGADALGVDGPQPPPAQVFVAVAETAVRKRREYGVAQRALDAFFTANPPHDQVRVGLAVYARVWCGVWRAVVCCGVVWRVRRERSVR